MCVYMDKLCAQSLWWNSICRSTKRNCQQTDWGVEIQLLCWLPNNELFGWHNIETIWHWNSMRSPASFLSFFAFPYQFKYLILFYVILITHGGHGIGLMPFIWLVGIKCSTSINRILYKKNKKQRRLKEKEQKCGERDKRHMGMVSFVSFLNLVSFRFFLYLLLFILLMLYKFFLFAVKFACPSVTFVFNKQRWTNFFNISSTFQMHALQNELNIVWIINDFWYSQ